MGMCFLVLLADGWARHLNSNKLMIMVEDKLIKPTTQIQAIKTEVFIIFELHTKQYVHGKSRCYQKSNSY